MTARMRWRWLRVGCVEAQIIILTFGSWYFMLLGLLVMLWLAELNREE